MPNPLGMIMDAVVPGVVDAVDIDELVSRIDIDAVVGRIDIDQLVSRIDIDVLVQRIIIDHLVQRIDIDTLVAKIDIDALVSRIDIDQLVNRIDIDHLVGRIDLDRVMAKIDIDSIVDRVDIDSIVDRADLAGIIRQSTSGIWANLIDLVRRQLLGIDLVATRVARRMIHRDPTLDPLGPAKLQDATPLPARRGQQGPTVSGRYAGPVSRAAALSLDVFVSFFMFSIGTAVGKWMIDLLFNRGSSDATLPPWVVGLMLVVWEVAYFSIPLALSGRTLGKAVLGLRVVSRDGSPIKPHQAIIRVFALPLSFLFFGIGLIGAAFGRERRTWHDSIAKTAEVIDWGDRSAALPSPMARWLEKHQATPIATPVATPTAAPDAAPDDTPDDTPDEP